MVYRSLDDAINAARAKLNPDSDDYSPPLVGDGYNIHFGAGEYQIYWQAADEAPVEVFVNGHHQPARMVAHVTADDVTIFED